MQELTPRQASVLSFIENFIRKNQQPPAEREIAGHFRIHQSAVRKHLTALERKGKLQLNRDGRSRGIRLANVSPAIAIPIIEDVAAGTTLLADGNIDRMIMMDAGFVGSEEAFLLHAPDTSMAGAGILEDDLLLVRRSTSVRNGELVVARVDDVITVRRYYDIAGRIVLEAADKSHPPITIEHETVYQLEGRVVALIRTMENLSPTRIRQKGDAKNDSTQRVNESVAGYSPQPEIPAGEKHSDESSVADHSETTVSNASDDAHEDMPTE
jgi:repressor LexA